MEQHGQKPDPTPVSQDSDTIFFPAINETTAAENAAIEEWIAQAKRNEPSPSIADSGESVAPVEGEAKEPAQAETFAAEATDKPAPPPFKPIPPMVGIIPSLNQKYAESAGKRTLSVLLLSLALMLALALLVIGMGIAYLACVAVLLCISLVLLVLCAGMVAAGLAGLSYGIVLLFTHGVIIALIEIGLSLILFGLILALSALSGELATGQLPRLIRYLTRLLLYLVTYLLSAVFGPARLRSQPGRKEANA